MKKSIAAIAGAAALAAGTAVVAQESTMVPAGAPAQGVSVPNRQSPGQSQQVLSATPPAPSFGGAEAPPAEGAPAPSGEGPAYDLGGYSSSRIQRAGEDERPTTWLDDEDIYTGVIPHETDSLPHISRYQRSGGDSDNPNTLTWIGFQPFEQFTRVFIQTGRAARYQMNESPDGLTLTLRLSGTRISLHNFDRFVDASYFHRVVQMIDARRGPDRSTDIVITLSRSADYTITADGNYLYIDFPN